MDGIDFKSMSDEELLSLEQQQSQSQDLSSLSDDQLLALEQQTQQAAFRDPSTVSDQPATSPISISERLKLSFADDEGREQYLKQHFSFVEKLPNGKYAVGEDPKNMQPIDPEGMFNDVMGDLADIVAEIPVIAGQIAGASSGAALGPAGVISGGGAGSAIGEAVKIGIGSGLGVRQASAEEQATDIAISGAFGAAGETIGQLAKFTASGIKKGMANALAGAAKRSADIAGTTIVDSPMANATAKTFKVLANVPEKSTLTAFKYGIEETLGNPKNMNKNTIVSLVDDMIKTLDDQTQKLGVEVGKQSEALISKQNKLLPVGDIYSSFRKEMIDLGVLDDVGRVNNNVLEGKNKSVGVKILSTLSGSDKPLSTFPERSAFQMPIKKVLRLQKQLGDTFDDVSGNMKASMYKLLNGDIAEGGASKGIRGSVREIAERTGSQDYLRALDNYSNWINVKSQISAFNRSDAASIENFIKGLENQPEVVMRSLRQLNTISPNKFLDKIEMWNAAQDFKSANPNLLRFGMIASTLGGFGVFQGELPKPAAIAGGLALGTPAGLRLVLRTAAKIGKTPSSALRTAEKGLSPRIQKALTAMLSQAEKQKSKQQNKTK